jgi:hypothetical protein
MGVIKLDSERVKDKLGKSKYIKAYVFDPDFVKLLEKMADSFDSLRTGKNPEEED